MKRILSTVLTVLILMGTVIGVMPVRADAAYSMSDRQTAELSADEVKQVINAALKYNYNSAEEMLLDELSKGYLVSIDSANKVYSLYINKYTGVVYYVNNMTGEILTSNPFNTGYAPLTLDNQQLLMSQVSISFFETANSTATYEYNTTEWAALYNQLSVTAIKGGFRVSYTLGDTSSRFLLPGMVVAEKFEEFILIPMIRAYENALIAALGGQYPEKSLKFFDNEAYTQYDSGCISTRALTYYYLPATQGMYMALPSSSAEYKAIDALRVAINRFLTAYTCQNPEKYKDNQAMLDNMYNQYPMTKDGTALYVLNPELVTADKKTFSGYITKYCPDYNFSMMYANEAECGYIDNSKKNPVVKCALEYSFNKDGSLSVRLPANSIMFDETVYTLDSVTPLQFFGVGDMTKPGYIFYPDGSGTIVNFDDFYNEYQQLSINLAGDVYGADYCYSEITGKHREQVTMPVFGLVSEETANGATESLSGESTVTKGYFAILEEGASLARIGYRSGGTVHKYISAFASYNPYPSDVYDLSDTISVGSLGEYIMVSDSKYNGSYITRYVMLNDKEVGDSILGAGNYYESSYVGMATCYRDYLKANGVLAAMEVASENNLPLYIEAFGSMEIITKILTFPVTQKIPLTTFDDIETMYRELSGAKENVANLIEKYGEMAATEKNEDLVNSYLETKAMYEELLLKIQDIPNINFKLTGFANGGMYYTYPTQVRWEKVLGGADGFKDLAALSKSESAKENTKFGVFPEFDFMFINFTAMFDGISPQGNVSKMVDNRYASKQKYDMVEQEWKSNFVMVISPDALMRLYSKFENDYSKYEMPSISVSTLGANLNSNFDEDNPINRDDAQAYVTELLRELSETGKYELMVDTGNIYSVKYADHILNIPTDSSRFKYSSHTIPFVGMVLHGSVSYAGGAFNYSGSPRYDMLRSIESGASLYYILCYQNTGRMKEDKFLNTYYGVDYENWYANVLDSYAELNGLIGSLQSYTITDHKILIGERIIDEEESVANFIKLKNDFIQQTKDQLISAIDDAFTALREENAGTGRGIKLTVDTDALVSQAAEALNVAKSKLENDAFYADIAAIKTEYEARYNSANEAAYVLNFAGIEYDAKYDYVTDSNATDGAGYDKTDYSVDNDSIVIVTYTNGEDTVRFILNYNIYKVRVKFEDGTMYDLDKLGYVKID